MWGEKKSIVEMFLGNQLIVASSTCLNTPASISLNRFAPLQKCNTVFPEGFYFSLHSEGKYFDIILDTVWPENWIKSLIKGNLPDAFEYHL